VKGTGELALGAKALRYATNRKAAQRHSCRRNGESDAIARTVATYMKLHPYGTSVRIDGDTGIVTIYSLRSARRRGVMSSDIFSYLNGPWHAAYSQHTAVEP
jgi:hypothetical protein